MNRSQVTTRRGDAGETTALSGDALSKGHPILECTGCVDELRAHTAFARLLLVEERLDDPERLADFLLWLLHAYFAIGSACSDPLDKHPEWRKVDISAEHLRHLESVQARLEEKTKLPPQFIVSATTRLAAQLDITCTVARRLERNVVRLKEAVPEWRADAIIPFLNRLSDCLFILARYVEAGRHETVDYGVLEAPPTPE
jgi:cob(I)alamin adenosyltransferase